MRLFYLKQMTYVLNKIYWWKRFKQKQEMSRGNTKSTRSCNTEKKITNEKNITAPKITLNN